MKNLTLCFLTLTIVCAALSANIAFAAPAKKQQQKKPQQVLVAYFSATGHTADVAKVIAESLHSSIVEIIPAEPYTGNDLDWQAKTSRASKEHADPSSRPAIREANLALEPFDTIFLGFPIWWGDAPRIILTYLETHNLAGKKIILFATSGGSGFGNIAQNLKQFAPKSTVIEGKVFPGFMTEEGIKEQVKNWLATLK